MVKEYRKVARRLSIHRRHEALSSLEQVKCRYYLKLFHLCVGAARKKADDNKKRHKMKRIANYYLMRRLEILTQSFEESPIVERTYLGFNDFSANECRNYFRCAKPHLGRIKAYLRISGKIKFKNRTTMSGEELLCRALYASAPVLINTKLANFLVVISLFNLERIHGFAYMFMTTSLTLFITT